jgi:hypothetical protein
MWDEEKEFEILEEVQEYDLDDETIDDFPHPELNPSADENEYNDVFEYEADFYYDDEEYE